MPQKKKAKPTSPMAIGHTANESIGLSSPVNRKYVTSILRYSTKEEIIAVLKDTGFQMPIQSQTLNKTQKRLAVVNGAEAYLRSPAGQRLLDQKSKELVTQGADEWLKSPEGQLKFERIKHDLLASKISNNENVVEHACREEITKRVHRWLDSPTGKEAIEIEIKRAATSIANKEEKPRNVSWVHQAAKGMENDGSR